MTHRMLEAVVGHSRLHASQLITAGRHCDPCRSCATTRASLQGLPLRSGMSGSAASAAAGAVAVNGLFGNPLPPSSWCWRG